MAKPNPYERFSEAVEINRDDLSDEVAHQPQMFRSVAEYSARAISDRDLHKDALKSCAAETYRKVRADLEAKGAKVTEAQVQSSVEVHPDYEEAQRQYREACLQADLWSGLKETWTMRSYALKDLVQLYVASARESDAASTGARAQVERKDYEDNRARLAKARRSKIRS